MGVIAGLLAGVGNWWLLVAIVIILGVLFVVLLAARIFGLYVQVVLTRAGVGFLELITMPFRKVNSRAIVENME